MGMPCSSTKMRGCSKGILECSKEVSGEPLGDARVPQKRWVIRGGAYVPMEMLGSTKRFLGAPGRFSGALGDLSVPVLCLGAHFYAWMPQKDALGAPGRCPHPWGEGWP